MYSELVQIKGKIDFTKTYVMFYLINFIDMFQTSWDRVQQKTWKVVKCFKKKTCLEYFTGKRVIW